MFLQGRVNMINEVERKKGVGAVVLASVLWGTTGTAASFAQDVSPIAIGAFATGVGGLLLVIYSRHSLRSNINVLMDNPLLLLLGSCAVALYPLAFYTAMDWSGVAVGTVISIASAPIFTVLLERLFSNKLISMSWMASFSLGAVGISCLVMENPHQGNMTISEKYYFLGVLVGLFAGLTYAIYSWVAKELIDKGAHSQSCMASMFGLASAALVPSLYFTSENLFQNVEYIGIALYMAVLPMFLGYLLFGLGLRFIEASRATLITLLEPVVATLLAVWIVGEKLTGLGCVGMLLIVACLALQVKITKRVIE
jgi:DME family drug/metabolite transporter